jgi:hypothetical protein
MFLDTTMTVDLDEVKRLVESDAFVQFLLNHTSDLAVAGYVLQKVMESIEADSENLDKE